MTENAKHYDQLTLDQRISLKGWFEEMKDSNEFWLVLKVFGFVVAVNYYIDGDINVIRALI